MSANETPEGEREPIYGPDGAVLVDSPSHERVKQEAKDKHEQRARERLQIRFNGSLAVTTVLLFVVGGYQACQSQRSAEAATKAADAAKATADAAIKQMDLTLKMVRGTTAAYVTPLDILPFGPDKGSRVLEVDFVNRGKLPATDFSVHINIACETLFPKRTMLDNLSFDKGGRGTTLAPDGSMFRTELAFPASCAGMNSGFDQGLIKRGSFTYLNGLSEPVTAEFCQESFTAVYTHTSTSPAGTGISTSDGWHACDDVPNVLRHAVPNFRPTH